MYVMPVSVRICGSHAIDLISVDVSVLSKYVNTRNLLGLLFCCWLIRQNLTHLLGLLSPIDTQSPLHNQIIPTGWKWKWEKVF